jgi:hypothetical protein
MPAAGHVFVMLGEALVESQRILECLVSSRSGGHDMSPLP